MNGILLQTIEVLAIAILLAIPHPNLAAQTKAASAVDNRPNIIFILADDQGWNGTSVQMHPDLPNSKSDFYRTPNIESLAKRGIVFSQAYSPGPMCSPTRASLQTGKSPAQLGMTNVGRSRPASPSQKLILPPHTSTLSTDEITIGETLRKSGYATAWFGKWHLGGDGPAAHGYDESDGPTGNADGNTSDPNNPKDIFGITKRGIEFIEKNVKSGTPFYLQLWHYAVHGPVQTRTETQQNTAARPPGKIHNSATFAGMTEDLDTGVGMILNKLEELSISDNTYVIYMSDHGSSRNLSSNAPLNRGKGTLWEGGMRVPLIIAGPGVQPGAYCNVPVVGWDLFPTFCELAGAAQPAPKADERGLEGVSLKPLFATGKAELNRPGDQIAFHFPHYGQAGPMSTITSGNFKLIKFYDTNEVNLFDIVNDPGETKNLANNNAAQTAKLNNQLIDYLASVNAGVPTANPGFDPTATESDTGRTGRRRSGGGRGGQRQAQIQVREKELSKLLDAVKNNDHDEIGRLIQVMKTTLANAPQRPRAARTNAGDGPTPRQQRERDLQQLEETHKAANMEKLVELIGEIKARLDSGNGRQAGSENGRRRELPNVPSRTDRNDN